MKAGVDLECVWNHREVIGDGMKCGRRERRENSKEMRSEKSWCVCSQLYRIYRH